MNGARTEQSAPWIVVVDGGGSKIAVAGQACTGISPSQLNSLVQHGLDRSNVRSWRFEGTGSAHPSTWPQAADNLVLAIEEVAMRLGASTAKIGMLKLALAGAGRVSDQTRVVETLRARCTSLKGVPIECMGDIEPLVDCKTGSGHTIAVILGTGSVVASRSAAGELIRAGGWGPLLGDACSGGAIGLSALRYLSTLLDQGQAVTQFTELAGELITELRSLHPDSDASLPSLLIQTASDRMQVAKLSGVVLRRAYKLADQTAFRLIESHVTDIVWQICQVARRSGVSEQPLRLNFTGGLAEHHQPLRQAIVQVSLAAGLKIVGEQLVDPLVALLAVAHKDAAGNLEILDA